MGQGMITLVHLTMHRRLYSVAAWLLAAALMAGLVFGPAAAVMADSSIGVEIKPGFDGYARHGSWAPVTVTVSNGGSGDYTGTAVLRLYDEYSAQSTEWHRDVTVPAGEKADVVFYVPAGQTVVQANVLGPDGQLAATNQTRMQYRDGIIAGVIASTPDTLRMLAGMDLGSGQQGRPLSAVTVVRPDVHDLPSFSRALGSLDILAFNDTSSQDLTAEQWAAIEAWVGQGGVLILGGGPGWRQTLAAVPSSLLPVEVTGTKTLHGLPALADFAGEELPEQPVIVSDGRLLHGRIVVEEGGVPLIVESRYGTGYVFYTAFDLGLDPVAFWRGSAPLWRQLLGGAIGTNQYGGRPGGHMFDMQWVVRQFPHLNFPSTRLLGLALLGYLVVIGPVNYIVLKRLDRRDWAWVTVPVIAVLVTAGIWGVSFRGQRDVLTNSIGVLHLVPGVERVAADTTVGVFAPTRPRLRFAFSPRQQVAPLVDWNRWNPGAAGEQVTATVRHGAENEIVFADSNNWTVRSFTVMQDVTVSGRIEGELRPTAGGDIAGTLTNNTPYDLEDVHVILLNTYIAVGDLPAGATRDVSVAVQSQGQMRREDIAWQIYGPQPPSYDMTAEQNRRRSILQSAFNRHPDGMPYPVTVFGWTKQPLTDLNIGDSEQHASLSLVYGAMEFTLPAEDFVLPQGLITGRMYDSDMTDGWYSGGAVTMESGWAAFAFQLPELPAGVELAELALVVDRFGPTANTVTFSLYNWQTGAWDPVAAAQNKVTVPDLDAYVYDGEVRLRAEVPQAGFVELIVPSAIVTGKKVGR